MQRKTRKWYKYMKLTVTKLIFKHCKQESSFQINFRESHEFSRCLHNCHLHHPLLLILLLLLLPLLLPLLPLLICVNNNNNRNKNNYTTSLIAFLFLLTSNNRELKKQWREPQRKKKTFEIYLHVLNLLFRDYSSLFDLQKYGKAS